MVSLVTWSVMKASPMRLGRKKRTLPDLTFLSLRRVSRISSMLRLAGSWVGRADTGCGFFYAVGDASMGAVAYD